MALLGKKVLRPGGVELTHNMIDQLSIKPEDKVVEFAPGRGATAREILRYKPASYIGIERDQGAAADLAALLSGPGKSILNSEILNSRLSTGSSSVLVCEALMTMQSLKDKKETLMEARRLLGPQGRIGIHEICVEPEDISRDQRKRLNGDLARSIKVNVDPLTTAEWVALLEESGFEVYQYQHRGMYLLRLGRMIQDEGLGGFVKIAWGVLTNPGARKRILDMRKQFKRHEKNMRAIQICGKVKP